MTPTVSHARTTNRCRRGLARPLSRNLLLICAVSMSAAAAAFVDARSQPPVLTGVWSGAIETPGMPLSIVVRLKQDGDRTWSGTIDIPQQRAAAVPIVDLVVADRSVSFRIPNAPGDPTIRLSLSDDGEQMSGTLTQGGATLKVAVARGEAKPAAPVRRNRPQTPQPPFPYVEEEVSFRNENAGVQLAGTLTLPARTGRFPAVVLITGSGPQDRDETLFGHKPFLVWADHLTRRGLAVLRVDDRGIGGSSRGPQGPTSKDFAEDVRAAVSFLRAHPTIDAKRIGLLGHSEGALLATMVAASTDAAFVVMLAGPGVPGDQLLFAQAALLFRGQGASEATIAWDRSIREKAFAALKAETDGTPNPAARQKLLDELGATPSAPGLPGGADARRLAEALLTQGSQPWFRFFLSFDPRPDLGKLACPVLAVNGDLDLQVAAAENLPEIERAVRAGGNRNVTVQSMPGLNHLFQTAKTGLPTEYESLEETIAPAVLSLVSDWILEQLA